MGIVASSTFDRRLAAVDPDEEAKWRANTGWRRERKMI